MIEKFRKFIKEAGAYSLEKRHRDKHSLNYKWGDENVAAVVTEVDVEISRMFRKFITENFSHLNYLIIDEENVAELGKKVFEKVRESEYQFVLDPIDGTANYAADIPSYGISIGILKHGKPLYGFLYAPAMDELVYTDETEVCFEKNENKMILPKCEISSSKVVLGHQWDVNIPDNFFDGKFIIQDCFASVINQTYLALGRVKGVFTRAYIWDISAAMAINKTLGMGFYNYNTKKELTEFSEEFFGDNCKCKFLNIACFEQEFEMVKAVTTSAR